MAMRIEDKLKLMQAASLLILVGLLVSLIWNVFIIRDLRHRLTHDREVSDLSEEERATILGLQAQMDDTQQQVETLQAELEKIQQALKDERATTDLLREDLQRTAKPYREATGQ